MPAVGRVGNDNSVVGSVASDLTSVDYDAATERFPVDRGGSNRIVIVELPEPGILAGLASGVLGLALTGRCGRRNGRQSSKP